MEREDKIGLGMAYLGCFIMTAAMIYYFYDFPNNLGYRIVQSLCVTIGGVSVIKNYDSWNYAIGRVVGNIRKLFKNDL